MRFSMISLIVVALLSGSVARASNEIVLSFDDIPAYEKNDISDVIREEYAHWGVHFNSDGRHSGIVRGGISNGDPGNWDLDGTNGPQFLGHNLYGRTGVIEFDMPIEGFQIDAARGHGNLRDLTFDAYNSQGLLQSVTLPSGNEGVWQTISLAVSGTTRIEYRSPENFGLDNMRFSPVPEPSALILLLTGALGVLACGWRRRR